MEIKVLWSDRSIGQLHDIYDYHSIHVSKRIAKQITKGIVAKTLLLVSNPLIGTIESLLSFRGYEYRFVVENNYKIIYRCEDHNILIVSVFDCRQNPQKIESLEK